MKPIKVWTISYARKSVIGSASFIMLCYQKKPKFKPFSEIAELMEIRPIRAPKNKGGGK